MLKKKKKQDSLSASKLRLSELMIRDTEIISVTVNVGTIQSFMSGTK